MAESGEFESLVYCLGPVGGQDNPVVTKASEFTSKLDYTTAGYARYVEEANNVIEFHKLVIKYFLESVMSESGEDPLAFIDDESQADLLLASIQKMKIQWKDMFKEHQKKLRETLEKQKEAAIEEASEESSSSAKIARLDPAATSGAEAENPDPEPKISAKKIEFPENIFVRKAKDFARVMKAEYRELRGRMGKALDRITSDDTPHDLNGFTWQNMERFAKWKYDLKTLGHLIPELESKFREVDLDLDLVKKNEIRLTKWMYFDDGEKDIKYHHRLLIPMELTGSVSEISALTWRQIRRYKKISTHLATKLPAESEAFTAKVEELRAEVLHHSPMKKLKVQKSIDSEDTLFGADDMPEET